MSSRTPLEEKLSELLIPSEREKYLKTLVFSLIDDRASCGLSDFLCGHILCPNCRGGRTNNHLETGGLGETE